MKTSKPQELTYFGRRASRVEVTKNKETRGIITTWIDDACEKNGGHKAGTTVIKVCSGYAHKGTLVVHHDFVYIGDFAELTVTELLENV